LLKENLAYELGKINDREKLQYPCASQEKLCNADYKCQGRLDMFLECIDLFHKGS
jgi:hypothetical protein